MTFDLFCENYLNYNRSIKIAVGQEIDIDINNTPIEPVDPRLKEYLTFEALENGEIGWWTHPNSDVEVHIFWSKDKNNWTEFTQNDSAANYVSVSSGENLYCRGINLDGVSGQYALDNDACNGFVQNSGKWNIKGNAMSLIDYNNMTTMTQMVGNFYYLFSDNDGFKHGNTIDIVNAIDLALPATTLLASYCYSYMFQGCTSLTTAPELPATTLADGCYNSMFQGCTSLTTAPELPATTLASDCYSSMFSDCTSLTKAPELPATTLASYCYYCMFQYCTSLMTAPELPATTLAVSCYNSMFYNCTSLTTAPELPATTLADNCYSGMFTNCTSLTTAPELPATTLAGYCYNSMFRSCTSLITATCLAMDISATGCVASWLNGIQTTGTLYVDPSMIDQWKGVQGTELGCPNTWTVQAIQ